MNATTKLRKSSSIPKNKLTDITKKYSKDNKSVYPKIVPRGKTFYSTVQNLTQYYRPGAVKGQF